MGWRDTLLTNFGPGLLAGITLRDWLRLLRDNRFGIIPSRLPRAMMITGQSIGNSLSGWYETRRYAASLEGVTIPPPLFVLGHWRSGTTHLHNLLSVDERFAFPNNYQSLFPRTFLSTEAVHARMISWFFPKQRPMDNMEWNLQSPQEDEFALCVSSFKSPYLGWVFPRQRDHYDRYLTFRGVPDSEITQWREAFTLFLKKLTWKYQRPLILKSPPHTCRIKLLLQLFPRAKFVHIHRDPYAVFQSSRHLFQLCDVCESLQRPPQDDLDDWILRQYHEMYDAFFEERALIPEGHFHEVCFEELEADPVEQVRNTYEALGLPEFSQVEPVLRQYVGSISGYKKNEFPELPAELRAHIAEEWRQSFLEWGYPA
jgi:hypothetical protein